MLRLKRYRQLLAVLLLAAATVAAAGYPLTIIELNHRFAEDLVPVLKPLVGPEGSISGVNDSLLVRASPRALAEVRQALRRLDVPARNLLVEVRRAGGRSASGTDVGISVDERVGKHGRVRIGEPARHQGPPGSRAWARAGSGSGNRAVAQQLRVLDGQEGFIAIGSEQPVGYRERYLGPDGVVVRRRVGYRSSGSGVYVRPRVQGNRVSIEVRAANSELHQQGRGVLEKTVVETRVSGPLGEWINLGQLHASGSQSSRGLLSSSSASTSRYDGVQVRVTVAPYNTSPR